MLIVILLIAICLLMFTICKLKWNAFFALFVISLLTAVAAGTSIISATSTFTSGFGSTLAGSGPVIALGIMLGEFLFISGGMTSIANGLVNKLGASRSPEAIGIAGFIAGIPVFGDVVNIMFGPMCRMMAKKTGISIRAFACTLSVATLITGSLVIPTAAPLTVATALELDLGVFFVYALIVSIVAMIPLFPYAKWLAKKDERENRQYDFSDIADAEETAPDGKQISFMTALSIIFVPILLIVIGSFGKLVVESGTVIYTILNFCSNKNLSMLVGVLYAAVITRPYIKEQAGKIMDNACKKAGIILLVTGAGGGFGAVLKDTGIADVLAEAMCAWPISLLLVCFIMAQIIRLAQGSVTVALTTTAAIMYPTIIATGASPMLCGLAICCGSIGGALPNDSGYWSTVNFFQISEGDCIIAKTIPGFLVGVAGLIATFLLQLCAGFLPGL